VVGPSISTIMVVVLAYCNIRYYGSMCYQVYMTGVGVSRVGVHLTPPRCLGGMSMAGGGEVVQ